MPKKNLNLDAAKKRVTQRKIVSTKRSSGENATSADTTSEILTSQEMATASAAPTSRQQAQPTEWTITRLNQIRAVPREYLDKFLYFFDHAVRKCAIQRRELVEFTYCERGSIRLVMKDLETGQLIREPEPTPILADDDDPLA